MVADFADNELAPRAAEVDASASYPREALVKLADLGLLGAPIPEALGGADGDMLLVAVILEELARGCGTTALAVATHVTQASLAIIGHGSLNQRQKYLPALASGATLAAFALAEHGAESDAGALACTATRDGDGWVLDGIKKYVVGGAEAGLYLVVAHTGDGSGTDDLALFLVEGGAQADGVRIVGIEDSLGFRGAGFAEVAFEACQLGSDALLGEEPRNFDTVTSVLEGGRIGIAAIACGLARGAIDYALGYAGQRRAFGTTIDSFEAIRNMFADGATRMEASRLLTYRSAALRDRGAAYGSLASMAKLYACESAYETCKNAVQILGGNGFSREYPVERMYRDAKAIEVVEAPGDLHRRLIARSLIGDHP